MTHPKYFLSLSLSLSLCFFFCFFLAISCNFNYVQDSIPSAKERTVNKLILIMCMNSHTTLYISHFLYFLSVCCTARRPNTGRLHTVNIIGKPDIVNPNLAYFNIICFITGTHPIWIQHKNGSRKVTLYPKIVSALAWTIPKWLLIEVYYTTLIQIFLYYQLLTTQSVSLVALEIPPPQGLWHS